MRHGYSMMKVHSSTNFLINSDTTVSVSSGQHDFLLKNTNLEYEQTGGDAVLYIDDFSKISGDLNVVSGNLKIVGADETYTGLPISMSDGKLQLGDQITQLNVILMMTIQQIFNFLTF